MSYLVNAVVLVCFYLLMCCSYLMTKTTYAVPSYVIKGRELITVNILDCEKKKATSAHVRTELSTFLIFIITIRTLCIRGRTE